MSATHRLVFVDRQRHRGPVLSAGAAVDQPRVPIDSLAGLEQARRALDVDIDVREGVGQTEHVVVLACQVEHIVLAANQVLQAALVPYVAEVDRDPVVDRLDVEQIAAVVIEHRVGQSHASPEVGEGDGQVAPDEAEPAGDEDLAIAEVLEAG